MKEKELQKNIKQGLEKKGNLVYKTMGGSVPLKGGFYTASSGWPDLIVFAKNGETYFIECKSETGTLRESQILKIKQLLKLNHQVMLAKPSGTKKIMLKNENLIFVEEE